MKLLLILALTVPAWCQAKPAPLPEWAGAGLSYDGSSFPHYSGWAALAMPLSQSQSVYSYSEYEVTRGPNAKPVTSTMTGAATILRTWKAGTATLYLMGVATAGAAVTSTATTAAFQGGGGAWLKFPSGITFEIVAVQNKAGSSAKPEILTGFGYAWGK